MSHGNPSSNRPVDDLSSPPTEPAPGAKEQRRVLSAVQLERAEALRVARSVLVAGSGPFSKGSLPFEVSDLVDVAVYVVGGKHPLDGYRRDADEGAVGDVG